jgi:hypothetical protein
MTWMLRAFGLVRVVGQSKWYGGRRRRRSLVSSACLRARGAFGLGPILVCAAGHSNNTWVALCTGIGLLLRVLLAAVH